MEPRVSIDLHCHSSASFDGHVEPIRLLVAARERGLTHVAITDHDTIHGALMAKENGVEGVTVIVGQEVRTTDGDLILLFLERPIRSGMTPEQTVAQAREQNAIVGLAHPFDVRRPSIGRGVVRPADLARLAALVDYVEVHNGRVREPTANARAADFAREYGLPQVAASDAHTEIEMGSAMTHFQSPIEGASDLLAALKHGGIMRVAEQAASADDAPGHRLDRFLHLFRKG